MTKEAPTSKKKCHFKLTLNKLLRLILIKSTSHDINLEVKRDDNLTPHILPIDGVIEERDRERDVHYDNVTGKLYIAGL